MRSNTLLGQMALAAILIFYPISGVVHAQETDAFLEGFTDVPLLPKFSIIKDSQMIFDTASGTIAEISLYSTLSITNGLITYRDSLAGLGWTCDKNQSKVLCNREGFALTIIASQDRNKQTRVTLRSEPID